jgi:hypothetical protein
MDLQDVVIPAKAGIQPACNSLKLLDSSFRGNDGKPLISAFCERIRFVNRHIVEVLLKSLRPSAFQPVYLWRIIRD